MRGEELYDEFTYYLGTAGVVPPTWGALTLEWRHAFNSVALEYLDHLSGRPRGIAPATRNYALLLRQYGRHAPSCPTSAPCTCGFAEIEKEWNPAA